MLCRDPDDAIFIQLAMAGRADYVVSGDADLTSLRESSPVPVISAGELKSVLKSRTIN
jgi:predicted nucleic acid-binding protein